jgi:hypothetical protein
MYLDDVIKKYKQHEVDFIIPQENDVPAYLDLYLLYESPENRWHKVQSLIYTYFNNFLTKYRLDEISPDHLVSSLLFPEVSIIGLGHCKSGDNGRGTAKERALIIKKFIFDNPNIKKVGITELARMSVEMENIGPDTLSDMVANFGMHYLIDYTTEQVKSLKLETAEYSISRSIDVETFKWKPLLKIKLPYFKETGTARVLVPKHLAKKITFLSREGFFDNYLRYILREEAEDRLRTIQTIGQEPKISFEEIKQDLIKRYGSVGDATRKLSQENPDFIPSYLGDPHKFEKRKTRRMKEKINWKQYADELKQLPGGKEYALQYAEFLRKVFTAMYGEKLLDGVMQQKSEDGIFYYDISFANNSNTALFGLIKNQNIKAGSLLIEAKNYCTTDVANKEFNQARGYTIVNGRELVFLVFRRDVSNKDIERSRRHFLSQRCLIIPISDKDITDMLSLRNNNPRNFDYILVKRFHEILRA